MKVVDAESMRSQVANFIRKMIVSGELPPGSKISERVVSEQFNVSRTPLKEALRILEAEGLVYTLPRKGSFVSELSFLNIQQVIYIRSSLDGIAAHFAAQLISKDELEELSRILEETKKFTSEGDQEKILECNKHFHALIRKSSRCNYIINIIQNLIDAGRAIRETALESEEERLRSLHEHTKLFEAIKNHDSQLAEKLTIAHVRRVNNTSV